VVTPQSLFDETAAALDTLGAAYADGQKTLALGEHITLLLPTNTKGLEFDAVIVIEPGRIASENDHGERLLYITLTRAVHHLTVIHADPLPATLTAPHKAQVALCTRDPRRKMSGIEGGNALDLV